MVIYKKFMLHLGTEWPSKQNVLTADIVLAEPGPWPGLKFGRAKYIFRGRGFCFNQF